MSSAASITLGMVAERTPSLAIACSRCDRAGRYYLDTLIARHGPDLKIPQLLDVLSVDCPKRKSQSATDLCKIHCPRLAELFPPALRSG